MKRYKQSSSGFTLVELLVVITIIGMLMALLLPAVNAAVELARAIACKNNMRNLSIAVNTFENAQQRFPGHREYLAYRGSGGTTDWVFGPESYGAGEPSGFSWIVAILPGLDHNDWFDEFSAGRTEGRYSELFVCPTDPPVSTTQAFNSYIINAGYRPSGNENDMENPTDGIAHDYGGKYQTDPPHEWINKGPTMSAELISSGDGMSYTLLISENVQDSEWYWGGKDLYQAEDGRQAQVPPVFVWHPGNPNKNRENPTYEINGRGSEHGSLLDVPASIMAMRPSSFHTGQVHVAFCDSRTIAISEGIEYVIYKQMMTPIGKESSMTDDEKTRILTDNDYN